MSEQTKKTLVLGASLKPSRYSYQALKLLAFYGVPTVAIGVKKGVVSEIPIQTVKIDGLSNIDTVCLYLGKKNQESFIDYILELNPKRIIFNPGTENDVLETRANKLGIRTEHACTLVLLNTRQY